MIYRSVVHADLLFPVKQRRVAPLVGWSLFVSVAAWLLFSFAGLPWLTVGPAVLSLTVVGTVWLAVAVRSLRRRDGRRSVVVAAVVLVAAVAGLVLQLPTAGRFAVSQPNFQALVERAGPPPGPADEDQATVFPVRCPARVGLYAVDRCEVTSGGYLFFDPLGNAMVGYAGFAYLPNGPRLNSDAGFELQELKHLRGPWYTFTASW